MIPQARLLLRDPPNRRPVRKRIQTDGPSHLYLLRPPKARINSKRMSLHNTRGEARGNCPMKNNARQSGVPQKRPECESRIELRFRESVRLHRSPQNGPPFGCAQDKPHSQKNAKLLTYLWGLLAREFKSTHQHWEIGASAREGVIRWRNRS